MASLNPRSLVSKLNATCHRALEAAAGLCLSRTNYNVEIEHWLVKLLEPAGTDVARILRHYDVDPARVGRELTRTLDKLKTGNGRAELSLDILDLIREAWVLASLEFDPCGCSDVAHGVDRPRFGAHSPTRPARQN